MTRSSAVLGFVHRRKKTRDQKPHPTRVCILTEAGSKTYDLDSETTELFFAHRRFAIVWRKLDENEEFHDWWNSETKTGTHDLQCKWSVIKDKDSVASAPAGRVKLLPDKRGNLVEHLLTHVPTEFEGLLDGDDVVMALGGSGDRLAAYLFTVGESKGVRVFRVPPNYLLDRRGDQPKSEDHVTLAEFFRDVQARGSSDSRPFYQFRPRDVKAVRAKECLRLRQKALQQRIACQQQCEEQVIGKTFVGDDGWDGASVEQLVRQELANDEVLQGLVKNEKKRGQELTRAVRGLDAWAQLLVNVTGCGERIAAGILAAISDVRRFQVPVDEEKIKKSQEESSRLEKEGNLERDLDKVRDRITKDTTRYQIVQMVCSWKRSHGFESEAGLLEQSLLLHRERSKLRRTAKRKSENKLKAFCGTYCRSGGKYKDVPPERQFPRRRRGMKGFEKPNWNAGARQSLYLLGSGQFVRRAESQWGIIYREIKERELARHPEPVMVDGKKRFTKGHIHKRAIWKSLSKFVVWLYRELSKLEEQAQRNGKE